MHDLFRGPEEARRLQQKVSRETSWIMYSRGAVHTGRWMAADDPEGFGWGDILEHLEEDRIFGFRLVPVGEVLRMRRRLAGKGFKLQMRDSFIGLRDTVFDSAIPLAARALPEGLAHVPAEAMQDVATISAVQDCIEAAGECPLPGEMLSGQSVDALTLAIADASGRIVATAFLHRAHNRYSEHRDRVFLGQVCVHPAWRFQGLGKHIAALAALRAFDDLKADSVYADIDPADERARRVVEHAGLIIDGGLQNGEAVPAKVLV